MLAHDKYSNLITKIFLLVIAIFILSASNDKTSSDEKDNTDILDASNLLYAGFTVTYDVSRNDFKLGVSERQLIKKTNSEYSYNSKTYATGVAGLIVKDKITEISHFKLGKNKISPSLYEYKNTNGKPNDNFDIVFDDKKNTVLRTKDNVEYAVAKNKQDLLSFQIAIMQAIQNNQNTIKFTIVDNDNIKEYSLTKTNDEYLDTENGEIRAQVLESTNNGSNEKFIFWCAKEFNYLPIKIQNIKANGDEILIKLSRINGKKINYIERDEEEDY